MCVALFTQLTEYCLQWQERALVTGRVVPQETLLAAIEQVPKSIKVIGPLADYFVELINDRGTADIELGTEGETWENFSSKWIQYVQELLLRMEFFFVEFRKRCDSCVDAEILTFVRALFCFLKLLFYATELVLGFQVARRKRN